MPATSHNLSWRDRGKAFRRTVRYFFLSALIRRITACRADKLPRLRQLLLKIFPLVFQKYFDRAQQLLPLEFAEHKDQILEGMLFNQVSSLLEIFLYEKLKAHDTSYITWSGEENLKKAVADHGSFIILSAHFGNWELIGYSLVERGYPIQVIARPQAINRMTELMNSFREKRGVQVLMENNLQRSLRFLKEGIPIGIVSDLNARELGYQVNFFDRTASFYPTPVILSMRSRVPLIPTFIERQRSGKQIVRFEPPVTWAKGSSMRDRVQQYVTRYEQAFRRRPDQWVWFHERYQHANLGRI